ncbi:hypothetical protein SRHO_G00113250 [Serrasalmus rhombeus]
MAPLVEGYRGAEHVVGPLYFASVNWLLMAATFPVKKEARASAVRQIDKQTQSMQVSWSQHFHLTQVFVDMSEANTLSAIERTTVGIYVARENPGHNSSDVGVILEVLLHNLENVILD